MFEDTLSFLERTNSVDASTTKIVVNEKCVHNLVNPMRPLGTLPYMAADRQDIQFQAQELASKLEKPTEKAWLSLKRFVGYLASTMERMW